MKCTCRAFLWLPPPQHFRSVRPLSCGVSVLLLRLSSGGVATSRRFITRSNANRTTPPPNVTDVLALVQTTPLTSEVEKTQQRSVLKTKGDTTQTRKASNPATVRSEVGVATTTSFAALQRVERRRSKLSLHETEFAAGISERLCPSLSRLPVLHEVHFSDAVVREIDSATYFGTAHPQDDPCDADAAKGVEDPGSASGSADGELSDAAFATFEKNGEAEDAVDRKDTVSDPPATLGEGNHAVVPFGGESLMELLNGVAKGDRADVPMAGSLVVQHKQLPPSDCMCLLRFLIALRGQQVEQLPLWLQRVVQETEVYLKNEGTTLKGEDADLAELSGHKGGSSAVMHTEELGQHRWLRMEHILKYLDGATAPVKGFTEDLSVSKAEGSQCSAERPAFLFTLYLENISVQNAVGHLCMLFSIPLNSFYTRSQCGKMTTSSVRCALSPGCLARHHLLLVNTMRLPGFVVRISDITELPSIRPVPAEVNALFGALARWQPVYYTEVLLRRVSAASVREAVALDDDVMGELLSDCTAEEAERIAQLAASNDPRSAIECRLIALQKFGAIHFVVNRDTGLARAASDVIHGYYKSALLHSLQRPSQPLEMKQFFKAPNEVTASKARSVSTDSTVRAVLKNYLQTKGDWFETVKRIPYAWRRRWINALRGLVWNQMASKRLRHARRLQRNEFPITGSESSPAGRRSTMQRVLVGDVVVKPEFREDCRRRQVLTLKAEYLQLVTSEEEARCCSLQDVYLPFLRGVYPERLFAPEDSHHPVMRRSAMMEVLKKRSAAALLEGLPSVAQRLLDVRSERSPMLFRRLLIKPLAMQAEILEDKPPVKAVHHYDACRLLKPDRWPRDLYASQDAADPHPARKGGPPFPMLQASALVPQLEVLEHSSIGEHLPEGVLPSEFFAPPEPSDFLLLGQAERLQAKSSQGGSVLLQRAPLTPKEQLQDRLYTLHIRAVCHSTAVGLSQMLREYFLLLGVKEAQEFRSTGGPVAAGEPPSRQTEQVYMDEVLQHKIHRLWRELDPETSQLTAPSYCRVCFNRDHDEQEQCAEYLWKRQVQRREKELVEHVQRHTSTSTSAGSEDKAKNFPCIPAQRTWVPAQKAEELRRAEAQNRSIAPLASSAGNAVKWWMKWKLRRSSRLEKWGVSCRTSSLVLIGLQVPSLLVGGELWSSMQMHEESVPTRKSSLQKDPISSSLEQHLQRCRSLPQHLKPAALVSFLEHLLALNSHTESHMMTNLAVHSFRYSLALEPLVMIPGVKGEGNDGKNSAAPLEQCGWKLCQINESEVRDMREVAQAFTSVAHATEIALVFSSHWISLEPTPSIQRSHPPSAAPAVRSLPPLPERLYVETSAPLHSSSTSWGFTVMHHDMELTNLKEWVQKALSCPPSEAGGREVHSGSVRILASSPPPSSLFCSSWAEAVFPHFSRDDPDALLAPTCSPRAARYYRLHSVNGLPVETMAELKDAVPPLLPRSRPSGPVLRLELVLTRRRWVVPVGETESRLDSILRQNEMLCSAAEKLPTAQRRAAPHDAPDPSATSERSLTPSTSTGSEETSDCEKDSMRKEPVTVPPPSPQIFPAESSVLCAPLDQKRLSKAELVPRVVTVAVHRPLPGQTPSDSVAPDQPPPRWGIRLQKNSQRLLDVRHDGGYHYHVYAYTIAQVRRVERSLRARSGGTEAPQQPATHPSHQGPLTSAAMPVQMYRTHVYFVEEVNHHRVCSPQDVREALHRASVGLSTPTTQPPVNVADGAPPSTRIPEAVLLLVRDYPLLRLRLRIRRGGDPLNPDSTPFPPMAPVGLQVDPDVCVVSLTPSSPVAAALAEQRLRAHCSLWRYVSRGTDTPGDVPPTTPASRLEQLQRVLAIPCLVEPLLQLYAALDAAGDPKCASAQWEKDDDELEESGTSAATEGKDSPAVRSAVAATLDVLKNVAMSLSTASYVDGVQLLQWEMLQSQLHAGRFPGMNVCPPSGSGSESASKTAAEKTLSCEGDASPFFSFMELVEQLADTTKRVRWRVVYAENAAKPLRTSEDLAAALAPGVMEETIVLQQCVLV